METYVSQLQMFLEESKISVDEIIFDMKKPKYLQYFDTFDADCDLNAIFIRKECADEDNFNDSLPTKITPRSTRGESLSEFDLSGEPLRTDLNESLLTSSNVTLMIEKDKIDNHLPLSEMEARSILSYACLHLKPTVPIWTLMEPSGPRQFMIGCSVVNSTSTRHFLELRDGDTTVEEMLEIHRSYISPHSKIDTEVMCDFTSIRLGGRESTVNESNTGKVTIQVFWKVPTFKIPLTNTSIKMDLHGTVGLPGSAVHFLWQQLELLHSYFELLSKWNENQSYPLSDQQKSVILPSKVINSSSNVSISEKITSALNYSDDWYSAKNNKQTLSNVLTELKSGDSHYSDVTDRLWLILIECTTHLELTNSLSFLLQEVRKASANTYMSADNHTRLGKAITTVLNDGNAANPLFLLKPVQLMVEIGLLKLRRDYITIFTETLIAKQESLEVPTPPSFTSIDGPSWSEVVSAYLCWMSKIHAALELMCVSNSNLFVKKATIVSLTRQILEKYVGSNSPVESFNWLKNNPNLYLSAKMDRFSSNIPQDTNYDRWLMKLSSKDNHNEVETKFLRTSEQIFPFSVLYKKAVNDDCLSNSITYVENSNYTLSQLTTIRSDFGK